MNRNMKFTEEYIIKYLDGQLSLDEVSVFEKELKINKSFADTYERYQEIHRLLVQTNISSPSPGFTAGVMKSLPSLNLSEAKFFNKTRLYVIALILIAMGTSLYYLSSQFYPSLGNAIANEITLRNFTFDLHATNRILSSDLLFKIVFYTNGLICLLLLDRAILKPYFERRKQRYSM
jgi:hypothetical protein